VEEQRAAAVAGGDELKQAAKRVREARRKPRDEAAAPQGMSEVNELHELRQRVIELTAENEALRQRIAELQG